MAATEWYRVENADEIPSPALLVYRERVEENVRRMVAIASDVRRLRPHVKTHKMPEMVRLCMRHGIHKFKCATIAEVEMAAQCSAPDVLLAYPLVGPNVGRFVQLVCAYSSTQFAAIADSEDGIRHLAEASRAVGVVSRVWLDIDNGMHRTGIQPDAQALHLYRLIAESLSLQPGGLHVYDGHIHARDPQERRIQCDEDFAPVSGLVRQIESDGLPVPAIVAGGSPTFPIHARREGVELSPGTTVFWDAGYQQRYPDLDFLCAAAVLTRVISKPGPGRLCFDLGTKAIASEVPHPRVQIEGLDVRQVLTHNEEHLVAECSDADRWRIGDHLCGVPYHICPTTALYEEAHVVEDRRFTDRWQVTARARRLTL
jgi:D-serine deaminase-like pyridoxal phosphate-dependent protein